MKARVAALLLGLVAVAILWTLRAGGHDDNPILADFTIKPAVKVDPSPAATAAGPVMSAEPTVSSSAGSRSTSPTPTPPPAPTTDFDQPTEPLPDGLVLMIGYLYWQSPLDEPPAGLVAFIDVDGEPSQRVPVVNNEVVFAGRVGVSHLVRVGSDPALDHNIDHLVGLEIVTPPLVEEFRFPIVIGGSIDAAFVVKTPRGDPISGVELYIVQSRLLDGALMPRQTIITGITDDQGRVAVRLIEADVYLVNLYASDQPYFMPETHEFTAGELTANGWTGTVILQPQSVVWGEVMDAAGELVAGVQVVLLDEGLGIYSLSEDFPELIRTYTHEDGFFMLDVPTSPNEEARVVVAASDGESVLGLHFATVPSETPVLIQLRPAYIMSVTIPAGIDPKDFVLTASISIADQNGPPRTVLIEPDGGFLLGERISEREWHVGPLPLESTIVARSRSTVLRFSAARGGVPTVPPGGVLPLRVVDQRVLE